MTTHTEDDLKTFFVEYQNTLTKYSIKRPKYINNMDELGGRIGCPTRVIIIVPTDIKELYTASPENRHRSPLFKPYILMGAHLYHLLLSGLGRT